MKQNFRFTKTACYIGYVVQALVINLSPLLYSVFHTEFGLSPAKLALIISVNFIMQLLIDLASALFLDRVGYRACAVTAHLLASIGLVLLGILPYLFSPFLGILFASLIMSMGGGLIEVIISPMVEALPTKNKSGGMALLHSFYCWGQMAVILLSTLFLLAIGQVHWRLLPFLWAIIPAVNGVAFLFVPILTLREERGTPLTPKQLFTSKALILFCFLMICAGSSEATVAQWASYFAERSLGLPKALGDLAGPCAFACLMGIGRVLYVIFGWRISLPRFLTVSGGACVVCYLTIALSPFPVLSLVACAVSGLTVSMMWPGIYSAASVRMPRGGTLLFALLAFSGDAGCTAGPTFAGLIAGDSDSLLSRAFLFLTVFPLLFFVLSFALRRSPAPTVTSPAASPLTANQQCVTSDEASLPDNHAATGESTMQTLDTH